MCVEAARCDWLTGDAARLPGGRSPRDLSPRGGRPPSGGASPRDYESVVPDLIPSPVLSPMKSMFKLRICHPNEEPTPPLSPGRG
eukprot:5672060-Pyramimonas_sp.AAC.1